MRPLRLKRAVSHDLNTRDHMPSCADLLSLFGIGGAK